MKHGVDDGYIEKVFIEHDIRKSTHNRATIILMKFGKAFWVSSNGLDTRINAAEKLLAKAMAARFVPTIGVDHVLLGFWSDDQFMRHDVCEPLA